MSGLTLFAEFHHTGDHEASWRLPTSQLDITDASYYVDRARVAARGRFDAVFFADFTGYDPAVRHYVRWPFEPTTLSAVIAAAVPDIGVVATGSTVFTPAAQLASTFATLQEVSGDRAGWNIVTAGAPAASRAFGTDAVPAHDDRYRQAAPVVTECLRTWGPDRPLLVQAGASDAGRSFAARFADVVFTAAPAIEEAAAFRADLRARARALGRVRGPRVLPGLFVTLGSTRAEARVLRDRLDDLLTDEAVRTILRGFGAPEDIDLDDPLGEDWGETGEGIQSRLAVLRGVAGGLGPDVTLRRLVRHVAGSRGHVQHTGTPDEVAELIARWYENGAADGFVVKFSHNPGGAEDFVDGVIPLLQRRGLFRRDYDGNGLLSRVGASGTAGG